LTFVNFIATFQLQKNLYLVETSSSNRAGIKAALYQLYVPRTPCWWAFELTTPLSGAL
jgi:hypothetical protein